MTICLHSFKDLIQQSEALNLYPRVQPGDVFWVENRVLANHVLQFAECGDADFHAVVVMELLGDWADVRVMTTKVKGNKRNGVIYEPDEGVRLKGRGVILTHRRFHRCVPVTALRQINYRGNVGPHVLQWTRVYERVTQHPGGKFNDLARRLALAP